MHLALPRQAIHEKFGVGLIEAAAFFFDPGPRLRPPATSAPGGACSVQYGLIRLLHQESGANPVVKFITVPSA